MTPEQLPADWRKDEGWHFWVWGTWADRWQTLLRPTWEFTYSTRYPDGQAGWDWDFRNRLVLGAGMKMIAPARSRSQHIGREGGTHCTPAQYSALLSRCFYAGVSPKDYQDQEVPDGT